MSYQFKMSAKTVGNLFVTWVQLMYLKFDKMRKHMFAPQSHHHPLPPVFRNKLLSKVRVGIDCVEFRCESSGDYKQQGNLYSQYKSHTTVKCLTGCAPNGSCMFVSAAFEVSRHEYRIRPPLINLSVQPGL